MRLLLDSNVVLWWLDGSSRLADGAAEAIAADENDALVSVVTPWELTIKRSIGKLVLDGDLRAHIADQEFDELPVVGSHAVALGALPLHHRDPFDRMLVVQAQQEQLTVVTADARIAAYDVPVLPAG